MENIEKLYRSIESEKQRSAWDKGVSAYALELVEQLGEQIGGGAVRSYVGRLFCYYNAPCE